MSQNQSKDTNPVQSSRIKNGATLTYQAHKFIQFQLALEDAFHSKTFQALNLMVTDGFCFHSPSNPTISAVEWFKSESAIQHAWYYRDINVQIFGDIHVVSFIRLSKTSMERQYIIDIWSESLQKLQSRYQMAQSASVPKSNIDPEHTAPIETPMFPNGRG